MMDPAYLDAISAAWIRENLPIRGPAHARRGRRGPARRRPPRHEPFVADDLLVHVDDPRAEATLAVLADFAVATQVLLFTQHDSVRNSAARLGRATVVEIGA